MVLNDIDLDALGQAIDTTFGRSSTPQTASYSVKVSLFGESRLLVTYGAIVNFGTQRQLIEMKRAYAAEADSIVSEVLKYVKATYKELTGSSLSTKQEDVSDSLEVTSMNFFNSKRSAVFRRKAVFEVT